MGIKLKQEEPFENIITSNHLSQDRCFFITIKSQVISMKCSEII